MKIQKVIKWVVDNRRALGSICGSLLIVLGYEKEGSYVSEISTIL